LPCCAALILFCPYPANYDSIFILLRTYSATPLFYFGAPLALLFFFFRALTLLCLYFIFTYVTLLSPYFIFT